MSDFLLSDIALEFIVDELYFIDEIVIKFSKRLSEKDKDFKVFRSGKVFEKENDIKDSYYEIEINEIDFLNYYLTQEEKGILCYFWLNYPEFESKFPIELFKDDLKNDSNYLLHHFESSAAEYVLESKNDYVAKDRIVEVLNRLKSASENLQLLLRSDDLGIRGVFIIQEIIIDSLLKRNSIIIETLTKRFINILPDFEYLKNLNQNFSHPINFSKNLNIQNTEAEDKTSNRVLDLSKGFILNSIEDIDDFVLKYGYLGIAPEEISGIKIEREYFYFEQDGQSGEYEKLLLSKEEYQSETYGISYTKINYEDFIEDFDLGNFGIFLRDQYLIDEYNEGFRPSAIDYITNAQFEGQAKHRLKNIVKTLSQSIDNLKNIDSGWHFNEKLNGIQKTVIELFIPNYIEIKNALLNEFENIYPNVVNELIRNTQIQKPKENTLFSTKIWFELAKLIASGDLKYEKREPDIEKKFYYLNESIESSEELAKTIIKKTASKTKHTSLRPYITNTFSNETKFGDPNYSKNVFSKKHLKGLISIEQEYINKEKKLDKYFQQRLEKLKQEFPN